MEHNERFSIIDNLTGQVIKMKTKVNQDTDFIFDEKNITYLKYGGGRPFIKYFGIRPPYKVLKFKEYFNELHFNIKPNSNILCKKSGHKYIPMDFKDIQTALNISERTTYSFIKESLHIGAFVKTTNEKDLTMFIVNPAYGYNGKGIPLDYYMMFKDNEDFNKLLEEQNIRECNIFLED